MSNLPKNRKKPGNFKHVKNLEKRKKWTFEMCQKRGVTIASKYRTFRKNGQRIDINVSRIEYERKRLYAE